MVPYLTTMVPARVTYLLFFFNSLMVLTGTGGNPLASIQDLTCNFDTGSTTCGWKVKGQGLSWTISNETRSNRQDDNKFLTTSWKESVQGKASLESHDITGAIYYCLSFKWRTLSQNRDANLHVSVIVKNIHEPKFTLNDAKSEIWRTVNITLASRRSFKILIQIEVAAGGQSGQICLDDIQLTTRKCEISAEPATVDTETSIRRSTVTTRSKTVAGKIATTGKMPSLANQTAVTDNRAAERKTPGVVSQRGVGADTHGKPGPSRQSNRTARTLEDNLTCDFNDGCLCGWMDKTDSLSWNVTEGGQFGVTGRHNQSGYFVTTVGRQYVKGVATLISPSIPGGSYCLTFYLQTVPVTRSSLDFIVYKRIKNIEVPLFNSRGKEFPDWTRIRATIQTPTSYKIRLDSIQYNGQPGQIFLDDITLSDGVCPKTTTTRLPTTTTRRTTTTTTSPRPVTSTTDDTVPVVKAGKQQVSKSADSWKISVGAGVGVLLVVAVIAGAIFCRRRRTRRYSEGDSTISQVEDEMSGEVAFKNPIYSSIHKVNDLQDDTIYSNSQCGHCGNTREYHSEKDASGSSGCDHFQLPRFQEQGEENV